MFELKLRRDDHIKGFAKTQVEVKVNDSVRIIKNSQQIILFEKSPAMVVVSVNGITVQKTTVNLSAIGPTVLRVDLTEDFVAKAGLSEENQQKQGTTEDSKADEIRKIMLENEKKRSDSTLFGWCYIGLSVAAAAATFFTFVNEYSVTCLFSLLTTIGFFFAGINQLTWAPYKCPQCEAPTIKQTSHDRKFVATRTEYRDVVNTLTHKWEQRAFTVSDTKVTNGWYCVTCDHSWNHSFSETVR